MDEIQKFDHPNKVTLLIKQFVYKALFIMLNKMVLTFKSMDGDEMLRLFFFVWLVMLYRVVLSFK